MRALAVPLVPAVLSLALGCGPTPAEAPPRAASAPVPLDNGGGGRWISAPPTEAAPPPSRVLFRQPQQGSILIGEAAPPPEPVRPRARSRVDVSFHHADLENALRFLADAGRFNLVVQSGLAGSVTAELRQVDAFDALVSIARANGAQVDYQRGIVMVHKPATAAR